MASRYLSFWLRVHWREEASVESFEKFVLENQSSILQALRSLRGEKKRARGEKKRVRDEKKRARGDFEWFEPGGVKKKG